MNEDIALIVTVVEMDGAGNIVPAVKRYAMSVPQYYFGPIESGPPGEILGSHIKEKLESYGFPVDNKVVVHVDVIDDVF